MKPIVFLDFDGVLNSTAFAVRLRETEGDKVRMWDRVDPVAVARVNAILDRTGADVVVSSTWRISKETDTVGKLHRFLVANGFTGRVVGTTPVLACNHQPWKCDEAHRGHEIEAWLGAGGRPPFVIIDDSADMRPHLDRLVRTDSADGIQDHHIDWAVSLLESTGPAFPDAAR